MSKTILLVDDEKQFRALLQDFLTGAGFEILLAEDGAEAVGVLGSHREAVDLVLLDGTPYESRRETFRQLKALRPGIPIVVMSGKPWADLKPEFEGMPVAGYLPKPSSLTELMETVGTAISQSTQVCQAV